jgi:hypothetical protein
MFIHVLFYKLYIFFNCFKNYLFKGWNFNFLSNLGKFKYLQDRWQHMLRVKHFAHFKKISRLPKHKNQDCLLLLLVVCWNHTGLVVAFSNACHLCIIFLDFLAKVKCINLLNDFLKSYLCYFSYNFY